MNDHETTVSEPPPPPPTHDDLLVLCQDFLVALDDRRPQSRLIRVKRLALATAAIRRHVREEEARRA